jgi:hypothetical protein
MTTLDSGVEESILEWCLGSSSVGQKSPVKVQHAEKATELTVGFRKGAVLNMGHPFLQWSGTHGRHFVTGEGDLRCSKGTLRRVD